MNAYRLLVSGFILLTLLTACGAPGGAQPAPGGLMTEGAATAIAAATADPNLPAITLRRSGGFAGKTQEWRIYTDGRVEAQEGAATPEMRQLPAQGVSELLAWLDQNRFFSASVPTLSPDDTCCDRFVYEMTATYNGKTNTIRAVDSPDYLPPELAEAIKRTAELLGVQF